MTSKVIEGHKSSSNFTVISTIPLLDGPLMLLSPNCVDLSLSLFFLFLSTSSSLIALNANLYGRLSPCFYTKGEQWTIFFFKCKESCWLKVYRFKWMIENKFWRNFFSRQNCFGGSTFYAFSKGQKLTSKFWKTPETKKMHN